MDDPSADARAAREDAAAARHLAAANDRDVAEIRTDLRDFRQATTASFNAMREDIVDLRTEMRTGFAEVDNSFAEVRGRLDGTAAGMAHLTALITALIDQQNGGGSGNAPG